MKYWKVFDIGLQNTFVYRWNFLLRAVFGIVPLIGTVCIWRAIFEGHGGAIGGYEYATMIFYFLLTILVDNLVTPTEDESRLAHQGVNSLQCPSETTSTVPSVTFRAV